MLAFFDRKNGEIHFAEMKPRRSVIIIAEHPNGDFLRKAVAEAGAQHSTTWSDGKKVGEGIAVPWFEVAKFPEDEVECAKKFARKVQERLRAH